MKKSQKKLVKKIIAGMSVLVFSAGLVNISEAAISRIPSISSRTHGMMQDRDNGRLHRNERPNNRRNDNQATAPQKESNENVNVNDDKPQETNVTNKNENSNNRTGSRRSDIGSRKRESPAKIVRNVDRSHDATYDEDDRYKAQRESYFEDDGKGRIVDEQREVIEERRQIGATESDSERGRETIINRYDDENDRRGSRGDRNNRDNSGVTVVINNNIPIDNNVNVDVKAENKNENKNDIKLENNTEVTSANNNDNDNDNENKTETNVHGGSTGEILSDTRPIPAPETKPSQKWQKGDVNHDGKVDSDDKQIIVDYQIGMVDKINFDEADMNSDGKINIYDTIEIARLLNDTSSDESSNQSQESAPEILWGDVNSDGKITADDHQLLLQYLQERITRDELDLCVADVNEDGKINITDAVAILNYVSGKGNTGRVGTVQDRGIEGITIDDNPMTSMVAYKPVIYLYPTIEENIRVNLLLDGEITCTYPKLNNGWNVTAGPDGKLTDKNGKHYNYLFWEGVIYRPMDFSTGFCVEGKDVEEFLQDKLCYIGMNEKEINDFIVYWLPQMQDNPYNIISFQRKNYVEAAELVVTPEPDTSIRIFMAWKKSANKVDIKPQQLVKVERKGFTLLEWGGGEVTDDLYMNLK